MVPADFVARLTAVRLLAFDTTVALGARPAPNAIEPGHTHQPSAASTEQRARASESSHARGWPAGRTEEPHARAAQRAYSPNIHHAPPAQSQASATRRVVARRLSLSVRREAARREATDAGAAPRDRRHETHGEERARLTLCSYISPLTHASARTSRATPIVSHAGEDVGVRRSTARAGAPRCQGRRRARPAGRARPGSASRQSGAAAPRVVLLRGGRRAPQRRCACGEAVVRGGAAPCGAQPERGRSAQGHSPDGCGRLAGRRKRAAKLCGPRVRRRRRSQPRRRQPHTLLPTRHAPPPRPRPCACRRRTMGAELALLEARRMETAEQVSSSC